MDMDRDISYKLFEDNDREDLLEMMFSLYGEDPEGLEISEEKINSTINEYKNNPQKTNIWLFKKGIENVGYALLVYCWSNEYGGNILIVDELYVAKNHRGKGIATGFLKHIETFENIVALKLETTPSNKRAMEHYKKTGFTPSTNTHLIKNI